MNAAAVFIPFQQVTEHLTVCTNNRHEHIGGVRVEVFPFVILPFQGTLAELCDAINPVGNQRFFLLLKNRIQRSEIHAAGFLQLQILYFTRGQVLIGSDILITICQMFRFHGEGLGRQPVSGRTGIGG